MKAVHVAMTVGLILTALTSAQSDPALELVPYEGHRSQFLISLPKGWVAYDQMLALGVSGSGSDLVYFSAVNLAETMILPRDAPESAAQKMVETFGKLDSGEIPSFFVDRHPAAGGMACTGFSKRAVKDVLELLRSDPMWQRGRKVVTALTAAPAAVGGCAGLLFRGTTRTRDGVESSLETRAASDGRILYLFTLRNDRPHFEQNRALFEASLSTLKLSGAP